MENQIKDKKICHIPKVARAISYALTIIFQLIYEDLEEPKNRKRRVAAKKKRESREKEDSRSG